ncbi:1-phosphofructokinase family hexose kinase [bacterium]|nr:1-phosphofructokinase family hexose kinase [bacterium]
MIVTVTLNPCIDLNLLVEGFSFSEPLLALEERKRAGGKGINVSVVLALLGIESTAVAPLGGPAGEEFRELSRLWPDEGRVRLEPIPTEAPTRTNTVISAREDGRHLKVNQKGGAISGTELDRVREKLRDLLKPEDALILAGSLPPGIPPSFYAELVQEFRERDCYVALDADREPLREAALAGPDLLKPNRQELGRLAGRPISPDEVVRTARESLKEDRSLCMVSDGAGVAQLVSPNNALYCQPPRADGSPTGAGDAALAGLLAGLMGWDWPDEKGIDRNLQSRDLQESARDPKRLAAAFRLAIACGSAAASTPDTEYFTRDILRTYWERVETQA